MSLTLGVTGHQEIPGAMLLPIVAGIEEVILKQHDLDIRAFSSLARGADQLFAETVIRVGGSLHVVIPCQDYESTFKNLNDLTRYQYFVSRASRIEMLDFPSPSEKAFLAAGRRIAAVSDLLIAIWDGKKARGKGGTADIVHYAESIRTPIVVIWPDRYVATS